MKKLYIFPLILLFLFSITGCQKNNDFTSIKPGTGKTNTEPGGMMVLGKKLENPYSVKNMKRAYQSLMNNGAMKGITFDSTLITVTDLYVRFLPQNSADLATLLDNPTLEIFDFPLDCEIVEEGVYYHDPTIPFGEITWLYTTVKPDFDFQDVEHEILEECFIPDDGGKGSNYELTNFLRKLEIEAFRITGNLDEGFEPNASKGKPSGNIQVRNTNNSQDEGVKKVKVRVHNFVKWDSEFTNTTTGHYQMSKNFITNIHYAVIFENETGFKVWGNFAFLLPATYNMGWYSNNGAGITFSLDNNDNKVAWLWATVNNGTYIYREELCPHFGISKPPANLRLWTFRMSGAYSGSAPMARQISLNTNTFIALLGLYAYTGFPAYLTLCLPDIFILKDYTDTKSAYSTIFHELAHASHYTKAGINYWLHYISGIITNGSANAYGDGTGGNDGYIGVGEMWGYYFEYATIKHYFGSAGFDPDRSWFKPGILQLLVEVHGFTPQQIFNCLTPDVNNHTKLKNKLIQNYGQATQVNQAFSNFGF